MVRDVPTVFSGATVSFNEVVLRFVADEGGAVVLGAVDFGGSKSHVLRKQFTLAVGQLARADVAPSPRDRPPLLCRRVSVWSRCG